MVRWKNLSCVARIKTLWYSCVRTTHKSPTHSLNLENSNWKRRQRGAGGWPGNFGTSTKSFIFTMTYLSVLPTHTTYIMTYMTYTFANIWLPDCKFVKSSTLLRLKTHFLSRWNPGKFDPKFHETRFLMRYDISKKIAADAAKFYSGGLAGQPGLWVFPVSVPCSHKPSLLEQVVPYSCFRNPYGKPHRCCIGFRGSPLD